MNDDDVNDDDMNDDVNDDMIEEQVPLYKKILCGNNWFGDFFYNFYKDLDCICCAFFRGGLLAIGIFSVLLVAFEIMVKYIF